MRKSFAVICFAVSLLATGTLLAQPNKYGVPLITNYDYSITGGSEVNWSMTQDLRGVVYVGNADKGVLEYDGVEWRNIPVPNFPIIRSMVTGDDGVVYVGAQAEFGRLEPNATGDMQYKSLSDTIDWDAQPYFDIWRTYYNQGKVYFCTFARIFIYDTELDEISILDTPKDAFFTFIVDGILHCGDHLLGLMRYSAGSYEVVPGGGFFSRMDISGLVKFDDSHLLVSTYTDGAHLLNTTLGQVEEDFIDPQLNEFLSNNVITYMVRINDQFALGTQFGGIVILDKTGGAQEIITGNHGINSQTITSVYANELLKGSGALWVTNFNGLSKLETNNPFRVFTEMSGFDGLITDIINFKGNLFLSTYGGLYFKESSSIGTSFQTIAGITDVIWHMEVINPRPGVEFLLVATSNEIYIIDGNLGISLLRNNIINPPSRDAERVHYRGKRIVLDPQRRDVFYTGDLGIIGVQYDRGLWREILRHDDQEEQPMEPIINMDIDRYGYLWATTLKRLVRIDTLEVDPIMKSFSMEDGLPSDEKTSIFIDPDTKEVLIGTIDGFYRYNYFRDTIFRDTIYNEILPPGSNLIWSFHEDPDGDYWISFENETEGWTEYVARKNENGIELLSDKPFQRLLNASVDVFHDDPNGGMWFSKSDELYFFNKSFTRNDTLPFQTLIRKVILNSDSLIYNGTNFSIDKHGGFKIHTSQSIDSRPEIKHRYNNIEFRWAAPFFEQEDKIMFRYKLVGFDKEWSDWTSAKYKDYTNLKHNNYSMQVKAKNVYGNESLTATYSFTIERPWYNSIPAIIAYVLLSGLFIYILIKLYTRRLKQENLRLEGIIQERTAEIRKQKEELTDSIEYASRIQRALLPPDKLLDENGIDHFILFRPRDIVSGDFYWMGRKNDKILIVAADCTGHGVPGAFMSMLGMTFLDEIVIKSEITSTDEILEQLRDHVISSLRQSGKSMEESTKDGMDLAMISLELKSNQIQYSGAYNPLYLVRKLKRSEKAKLKKGEELDLPRGSIHDNDNLLIQIRADQMPIGISEKTQRFNATNFKDEGFNIYMFSDGFLDQFGGPQGKKFMSKNFKKLILELQSVPMEDQGAALEKILLGWMGEISQIDDILVMGIRMGQQ